MSSLTTKRRSAYTLSTISVSLVLFIIGAILYLGINSAMVTNTITDSMRLVVILNNDTTEEEANSVIDAAKKSGVVARTEFISSEQAEEDFKAFIGEDFSLKLGKNPLPPSINIYLNKSRSAKEGAAVVKRVLKEDVNVDEILFSESVMDSVTTNINNFKIILGVFILVLLFISVIMIDNTIRMAVFSKRFLIKSMQLIGATRGFIRMPFMRKAILQAFVSTILATVMLAILVVAVKRSLPEIELMFDNYKVLLMIPASLFCVGLLVCISSTAKAVNRYMNLKDDQLHIY